MESGADMSDIVREIVLDTETTGLDPIKGGHRLAEIGCVELMNHIPTGRIYHAYINPERDFDAGAQAVTGLTLEFLKDKPIFKDIAKEFLEFIGNDTLIIHNAPFDLKFLNFELRYADLENLSNPVIDTLIMARQKFPGSPASLDALCKKFDISTAKREKHGAIIDCELLADVYLMLIGGPQKQLFDGKPITSDPLSMKSTDFDTKNQRPIRKFNATEEELTAHKAMLDSIKSPLWSKNDESVN